jgi:AcrR family transcriptional regulator
MRTSARRVLDHGPARTLMTGRRGRRPGGSRTREAILAAAQRQFAETGYDRTSVRSIAREAEVDQKLVSYFFGSKQQLFMAAVAPALPSNLNEMLPQLLAGGRRTLGHRIAGLMAGLLENPASRDQFVGAVRAAASEPEAARMLRDMRERLVLDFGPTVAETIGDEDVALRIAMVNVQALGLIMAREVVGIEPLRSLSSEELVAVLAPIVQRLLTGPIARPS